MDAAKFTYERTAAGWQLQTDEPGLGGPLEGAFRYELRLGDLPAHLAVVGHCRVMGLWCVFARETGGAAIRGIALRADRYEAHGYDPFVVAAEVLGSQSARMALASEASHDGDSHPETAPEEGYLAEAHRRFLLGNPASRQAPYCSALPAGFPRRLSPLSAFVVEGGGVSADLRAEATRPVDRDLPPVASTPSTSHPAAPRTTEPIPILPGATLGATADPPGAPSPSTLEQDRDAADLVERGALRMELDRVERELSHRLRALQIALALATALLAAALAAGLWWTSKQLQRADPSISAPRETQSDPGASGRWLP